MKILATTDSFKGAFPLEAMKVNAGGFFTGVGIVPDSCQKSESVMIEYRIYPHK